MHAIVCEGVLQVDGPIVGILCGALTMAGAPPQRNTVLSPPDGYTLHLELDLI